VIATTPVFRFKDHSLTRQQIEDVLLLPGKVPAFAKRDELAALRQQLEQEPGNLLTLGLRQVPVFAVYAFSSEGAGGYQWSIREQTVWVDHTTNKPLEGVVTILDSLPPGYESCGRRDLLELLPPTYCRRRSDALGLVKVLTALGDKVDLDECTFRPVTKDDGAAIARFNQEMGAANRAGISEDELTAHTNSQGISLDLAVGYDRSIVGVSILRAGARGASKSAGTTTAEVRLSPRVRDARIEDMLIGRCLRNAAAITDLERIKVVLPNSITR
jgi:hypothetical protein